ncbi:hypothetical protein MRX96_027137 [Rhipicephalus microplus]
MPRSRTGPAGRLTSVFRLNEGPCVPRAPCLPSFRKRRRRGVARRRRQCDNEPLRVQPCLHIDRART